MVAISPLPQVILLLSLAHFFHLWVQDAFLLWTQDSTSLSLLFGGMGAFASTGLKSIRDSDSIWWQQQGFYRCLCKCLQSKAKISRQFDGIQDFGVEFHHELLKKFQSFRPPLSLQMEEWVKCQFLNLDSRDAGLIFRSSVLLFSC